MYATHLKTRSHEILEAVILAYSESAAPVGSQSLRERYHLGVSPATIRNAMAELEAQGLITHPHTSAGRVPTDLGYRYYVDLLMESRPLTQTDQAAVEALAQLRADDSQDFLAEVAKHLSDLTQAAGVVLAPSLSQGSFHHLEFIATQPREVVGVLISSEGMVRHARLEMVDPVSPSELVRLVRFLNQELSGLPLSQVHTHLEKCLLEASGEFFFLYKRARELFSLQPLLEEEASVILKGAHWVFESPEFQDLERARRLVHALEDTAEIAEILQKDISADVVKVHIGSENRGSHLTDCTVVSAPFHLRGGASGTLGVLGPTRMQYSRVTSLVRRMADFVNRVFQERWGCRDEKGRLGARD